MGGGWSTSRPGGFTPWERDPLTDIKGAEWASASVWTGAETLPPQGFDPRTTQPVARGYTDSAIPGPSPRRGSENFAHVVHVLIYMCERY
jgi:hypothetical protein